MAMRQRGGYGGDKPVFSFTGDPGRGGVEMSSMAPDGADTSARQSATCGAGGAACRQPGACRCTRRCTCCFT